MPTFAEVLTKLRENRMYEAVITLGYKSSRYGEVFAVTDADGARQVFEAVPVADGDKTYTAIMPHKGPKT